MGYHVIKCLKNLKQQYRKATGDFSKEDEVFNKNFINWLIKRNETGIYFIDLLDEYGFDFYNPSVAEIGKSEFDSIVLPYKNTIITPYADSFHDKYKERIIDATFHVESGVPAITTNNYLSVKHENKGINLFRNVNHVLIHNPYNLSEVDNFKNLQNSLHCGATLGIFGNSDDKDKDDKVSMLTNQYKYCDKDDVFFDLVDDNNNYLGIITPKIKTK